MWSRVGPPPRPPSVRMPPRQEHRRLHLSARNGGLVADAHERAPLNLERRVAVGGDIGAPSRAAARQPAPSGGRTGSRRPRDATRRDAATTPESSRIVVPELAQSRGASGGRSPRRPSPSIRTEPGPDPVRRETVTLRHGRRLRDQASSAGRAVLRDRGQDHRGGRTSSEAGSPASSLPPSAVAARISHRCAIDLSPGTRACPPTAPPGRIVTRTR